MTTWILAQAESESDAGDLFFWSAILIGLLVMAFAVVSRIKRRLSQADQGVGPVGFTLSDLRQMHRSGQMSDEEFERAKEKVVEAARRAAERAIQSAQMRDARRDPSTDAIRMAAELESLRRQRQEEGQQTRNAARQTRPRPDDAGAPDPDRGATGDSDAPRLGA